jgi:hypothetical protein
MQQVWHVGRRAGRCHRQAIMNVTGTDKSPYQLKSPIRGVDPSKGMPKSYGNFLENNMNSKLSVALLACMVLLVCGCGSSPQNLILGKWEISGARVGGVDDANAGAAGKAIKMSLEFKKDGTAQITMMGQTLQGTYKINGENELEWTMGGITTTGKLNVTGTELEVTDAENRTIKYRRE